jgi:hypothetical protein
LKDIPWDYIKENFWDCVNWSAGNEGVAKYVCDGFGNMFNTEIDSEWELDIQFQKIVSPREYNFVNDSINVLITLDTNVLRTYIEGHLPAYSKHLYHRYSSRSGFISFHPNNVTEWRENTKGFTDFSHEYYLGSMLEFVTRNEIENPVYDLYNESNCHEGFMNGVTYDVNDLIKRYQKVKVS